MILGVYNFRPMLKKGIVLCLIFADGRAEEGRNTRGYRI